MTVSDRKDPPAGPFANLGHTYFENLDALFKSYEPLMTGVSRWNLEVMNLVTRRTRAWMDIPARARSCKTPQDWAEAQQLFWKTLTQDYSEGAERMTRALGTIAPPGLNGAADPRAAPPRDYIDVKEKKATVPAEEPKRERRAA